jgi:nuclear GTP-binding protein
MDGRDDGDMVLKGAVRVERLEDPTYYVSKILKKVKKETLQEIYDIDTFEDDEEFLKLLARKQGKLIKVSRRKALQFLKNLIKYGTNFH